MEFKAVVSTRHLFTKGKRLEIDFGCKQYLQLLSLKRLLANWTRYVEVGPGWDLPQAQSSPATNQRQRPLHLIRELQRQQSPVRLSHPEDQCVLKSNFLKERSHNDRCYWREEVAIGRRCQVAAALTLKEAESSCILR